MKVYKRLIKTALAAGLISLTAAIPARVFLRVIYRIPELGEDFSNIFEQIKSAPMSSPFVFLMPIAFLFCISARRMLESQRRGAVILLGIPVYLIMFVGAIWFTKVNGVMFGEVLSTLIPLLADGVL